MPRAFSMAIQSERVLRPSLFAFTWPASWMAPPNSSSFSVSVVLPASGCEMMANVRRRRISAASLLAAVPAVAGAMARCRWAFLASAPCETAAGAVPLPPFIPSRRCLGPNCFAFRADAAIRPATAVLRERRRNPLEADRRVHRAELGEGELRAQPRPPLLAGRQGRRVRARPRRRAVRPQVGLCLRQQQGDALSEINGPESNIVEMAAFRS